jgi:LAS superfamily LD-carboxypeptidase LdcB
MKLKGWHFLAAGLGGGGLLFGLWYFIWRLKETEVAPELRLPERPDLTLGDGQLVLGYRNGKPVPVRLRHVGNGQFLDEAAGRAWLALQAAARASGFNLTPVSGFRSMAQQTAMYNERMMPGNKPNELAKKYGVVAKPGYSNHQDGTAIDIGNVGGYGSAAYAWLKENARRFGFVDDVRGEYWHWRYVGGAALATV